MKQSRFNILFITTDHQRADTLFTDQAGIEVTPHLNQLAKGSSVFTRAYNNCPICVPARTALATGKYPTNNGVVFNDWKGSTAGDHKTVHQFLGEEGYRLAHSGVHHIKVKPDVQERTHFEMFRHVKDYKDFLKQNGVVETSSEQSSTKVFEMQNGKYEVARYSNSYAYVWEQPISFFKDFYFTDHAVQFIEDSAAHADPFALFVNIWAPHPPLAVPEPYASMFDPDQIELPPNVGIAANGEPPHRRKGAAAQLGEGISIEEWRKTWAAHLGLTRLADDCVGRLINALKQSGKLDDTIILFMSDHGDHLGQHRMYQKMEMYEQAVRVPLIIRVPGAASQQINDPVSHLDILPTLLELLEIDNLGDLDGISLKSAVMEGVSNSAREVFCQFSGNSVVGDIRRAMITSQYKYIYDPSDDAELYDLETDPLEMTNLAANTGYAKILESLHQRMKVWGESHGDWVEF